MVKNPGLLLLLIVLLPSNTFAADSWKTVGRKSCVRCHATEDRTVTASGHDSDRSCEQCHGSGEQHLRRPERGNIFSYSRATAEEVKVRCQECHRNAVMNDHAKGDVSCNSCHSIHHYVNKKHLLKPGENPFDNSASLGGEQGSSHR